MKKTVKKTVKKQTAAKRYVATCVEVGDEDDNDVTSIGVFSTRAAAERAIEKHIAGYFDEWVECSCGEAYREDDEDEITVDSGDGRYVRKYSIKACRAK